MEKKHLSDYTALADLANGGTVKRPVYVVAMENMENKSGKTQVKVKIKDGAELYTVAIFDTSVKELQERYPFFDAGAIVEMEITKKDPFYNASADIREVSEVFDLSEIAHVATSHAEKLYEYILENVKEASTEKHETEYEPLSKLVVRIYEDYKEQILRSSSATACHHMGIGGNVLHTAEVLNICKFLTKTSIGEDVDKEILYAAAALHDIGKLFVYETDQVGEATVNLNGYAMGGHHYDSLRIVNKEAEKANYNPESMMLLRNAIASHHGSREFGDLATPIGFEAVWLNFADDLSAKHFEIKSAIETLEPGTITPGAVYPLKYHLYRRLNYKNK